MKKFLTIGLGVSIPQIRDFAVLLGLLIFCSFFWFLNKAIAYTPRPIFMKNTSNDVIPGKEVPFGGSDDYILYLNREIFEKTAAHAADHRVGQQSAFRQEVHTVFLAVYPWQELSQRPRFHGNRLCNSETSRNTFH